MFLKVYEEATNTWGPKYSRNDLFLIKIASRISSFDGAIPLESHSLLNYCSQPSYDNSSIHLMLQIQFKSIHYSLNQSLQDTKHYSWKQNTDNCEYLHLQRLELFKSRRIIFDYEMICSKAIGRKNCANVNAINKNWYKSTINQTRLNFTEALMENPYFIQSRRSARVHVSCSFARQPLE